MEEQEPILLLQLGVESMSEGLLLKMGMGIGLLLFVVSIGCTSAGVSGIGITAIQPDPETGIVSWINAVNQKDVHQIYILAPGDIKKQISYEQFAAANENNALLTNPNLKFSGYEILNKTSNQSTAKISAMLVMQKPVSENSTQVESVPVFYTFILTYEDNQWKVWTI
ncbi:hypothetical protein [Methanoregula sp.]|uniref:hypothetical protein n=1 Tax=Methanoregula sp. TaxID=2052170 RepID=UPI002C3E6A8D|nr:hypothetical protein [Methanoregula sp.]HVP97017.1 hypothetical protein [Methanoregula sp.]